MGKGQDKLIQQQLMQQNQQYQNLFQQYLTKSEEKSPIQKAEEDRYTRWTDWFKKGDYRQAPEGELLNAGMFRQALLNRELERTGVGASQFAEGQGNASLLQAQRTHMADRMSEANAMDYTQAIMATDADVRGRLAPYLMNFGQQQNQFYGSLLGNMAMQTQNSLINFKPQPSPWWGIAQAAIGGASGMFTGRFGGK